jgi:hypothetical protein
MALDLYLQFAHHTHDEFETLSGVTPNQVLQAFDEFDWTGETKKAETLQRVSPTLSVESDAKDRLIWVSSVAGIAGLEFISECRFPGEVRKFFGLSKGFGTVKLSTQTFNAGQAREALRLFVTDSYPRLRELYQKA